MDWYEHYEAALRHLTRMQDSFGIAGEEEWLRALEVGMLAHKSLSEVLIHCTQQAHRQGATKKRLATILEMSPSGLRGLRR